MACSSSNSSNLIELNSIRAVNISLKIGPNLVVAIEVELDL